MRLDLCRLITLIAAIWCWSASAADSVEYVDYEATKPVGIPGLKIDWRMMGYNSERDVRGIRFDWNGDGKVDTLVVSAEALCGQAGCPYELVDGRTGRVVGDFFGQPLFIHAQKINGWPVLTMYGHSSAESGTYTSMVYDGTHYVVVSSVMLYGKSVSELFDNLIPRRRNTTAQ